MSEQRISDEELDALIEKSCVQRPGGMMLTVGRDAVTNALLYDLRDARAELARLREGKGGAFDQEAAQEAALERNGGADDLANHCRIAFVAGAKWQSQQPAPSAPPPALPAIALWDLYQLAFIASGDNFDESGKLADAAMKNRQTK